MEKEPRFVLTKTFPFSLTEPVECWFIVSPEAVNFGRLLIVFLSSKFPI